MEQNQHGHHSHHHHYDDYASQFKRKSLQSIEFRRNLDKWLKIALFILAVLMILLVILACLFV